MPAPGEELAWDHLVHNHGEWDALAHFVGGRHGHSRAGREGAGTFDAKPLAEIFDGREGPPDAVSRRLGHDLTLDTVEFNYGHEQPPGCILPEGGEKGNLKVAECRMSRKPAPRDRARTYQSFEEDIMRIAIVILAAAIPALAQEIKFPSSLDRLASKAEESVDVTLDKTMLHLAGRFLGDGQDEAKAKKIMAGLDSVTVKSFQFASEGQYDPADLDAVRAQLRAPDWLRIVGVKAKGSGDNVDVYAKPAANGKLGGVMVIAAEPRELTVVSIVGTLEPEQLAELGGEFHIPELDMGSAKKQLKKEPR